MPNDPYSKLGEFVSVEIHPPPLHHKLAICRGMSPDGEPLREHEAIYTGKSWLVHDGSLKGDDLPTHWWRSRDPNHPTHYLKWPPIPTELLPPAKTPTC